MSFDEIQFPAKVAYGASGGPQFSTLIQTQFGGFEQRNQNWSESRGSWDVSTGIKSTADIQQIISFFRARRGRARGFRFKDWSDYTIVNGAVGTGNGVLAIFQIKKRYTSGAVFYDRIITKPVSSTVKVYLNSVLQTLTTHYSLNSSTGVITFVSPVAIGVTVSVDCEFDVPARFDIDQLNVSVTNHDQYISSSIPIVEIRV